MTENCPVCRRPLPRDLDLVVDLLSNCAILSGKPIKLTPSEAVTLHTLASNMRRPVRRMELFAALYGAAPEDGGPDPKIIDVWICRVRAKIAESGYHIVAPHNQTYRLTKAEAASA